MQDAPNFVTKLGNAIKKIVEVDKKILSAGQHHGSPYYQHLEFIKNGKFIGNSKKLNENSVSIGKSLSLDYNLNVGDKISIMSTT